MNVGWRSRNLPGYEFRQAQTAITAYHVQQTHDFSLAYPTPVLGKPWAIPMEFPLYQWTVVVVSDVTGLGLVKAGRLVSIVCFYLTLPAIFLLLRRWKVSVAHCGLVLAVVLTCPLYVFYTRGVFIETMALMFSVWFGVAYVQAMEDGRAGWMALAVSAGLAAGLVKPTTWIVYLLPVAIWSAGYLWRALPETRGRTAARMIALVLPGLIATWAWTRYADHQKSLNPMAHFLSSTHLSDFNFGTWATRLSPALWLAKLRILREEITWWPGLVAGLAAVVVLGRAYRRIAAAFVVAFGAALVFFPQLYALHDYYYMANTLLLLVAMGLGLVALCESTLPTPIVFAAALAVVAGQANYYRLHYLAAQRGISAGGNGLSELFQLLTDPRDVIVVAGEDWNSMTPFYARRRALMLRDDELREPQRVRQAIALLADERIGALALADSEEHAIRPNEWFVAAGLDTKPLLRWRNFTFYGRADGRAESYRRLRSRPIEGAQLVEAEALPPERLAGEWIEFERLSPEQRAWFESLSPRPLRFFATYGPARNAAGEFSGHPVLRLVFRLAAGAHVLRLRARLADDAFDPQLPRDKTTDGVEMRLATVEARAATLWTRTLDPRDHPSDRGWQDCEARFSLAQAAEVELSFGPGANGRDTRDWLALERVRID